MSALPQILEGIRRTLAESKPMRDLFCSVVRSYFDINPASRVRRRRAVPIATSRPSRYRTTTQCDIRVNIDGVIQSCALDSVRIISHAVSFCSEVFDISKDLVRL